jgi:hypothetical protein
MLRFLLDEHVPRRVSVQLRTRLSGPVVYDLQTWNGGRFLGIDDDRILMAAHEDELTLVTFDVSTIPDILSEMAATGADHSGVVFISRRTFVSSDVGGITASLQELWKAEHATDWRNRIWFLRRPK